jgi:DNA primase
MSKWKHSHEFKTQEHLYNYWFAKEYIIKQKYVILVESPGNVWRLEESNLHNSVAIFGSSLSDKQKMLLDISGALSIITIMDNDQAGQKATEQIIKKCNKTYNVFNIPIKYEDIASMSVSDIQTEIIPQIEALHL